MTCEMFSNRSTSRLSLADARLREARPCQVPTQAHRKVLRVRLDRNLQQPLNLRLRKANAAQGLTPCSVETSGTAHAVEAQAEASRARAWRGACKRPGESFTTDDVRQEGAAEVVERPRLRGCAHEQRGGVASAGRGGG